MAQSESVKPEEFGEALYRLFEVERICTASEHAFLLGFSIGRVIGEREGSVKADALIEAVGERAEARVRALLTNFALEHGLPPPDPRPRPAIN